MHARSFALVLSALSAACEAPMPTSAETTATRPASLRGDPAPPVTLRPLGSAPTGQDPATLRVLAGATPAVTHTSHVTGYTDNPSAHTLVPLSRRSDAPDARVSLRGDTPEWVVARVGGEALGGWHDPDGFRVAPLDGAGALGEYEAPEGAALLPAVWRATLAGGPTGALLTQSDAGWALERVAREGALALSPVTALPPATILASLADAAGARGHCWAWAVWQGGGMTLERRCDALDHGPLGASGLGATHWDVTGVAASPGLCGGADEALGVTASGDVLLHTAGDDDVLWPAAAAPFEVNAAAVPSLGCLRGVARVGERLLAAARWGEGWTVWALEVHAEAPRWAPVEPAPGVPLVCPAGARVQQEAGGTALLLCADAVRSGVWRASP